jgi:hypothetical protein
MHFLKTKELCSIKEKVTFIHSLYYIQNSFLFTDIFLKKCLVNSKPFIQTPIFSNKKNFIDYKNDYHLTIEQIIEEGIVLLLIIFLFLLKIINH